MAEVSVSVIGKDALSASFKGMQSAVASLAGEVQNLGSRAVGPVTVALGNLLSDVVTNGVNSLQHLKSTIESFSFIKLNMQMEMTRSSFTTLLKSADEANKMLDTLRMYANQTPFEFSQLTAATKKMLAFGFSAKEITTDFMGLGTGLLDVVGNASSALGAGQEGIDRITRALGQMRGLARVSAEDMNQLIDVGVQGYQILAEQLGMTVKEVRDAMKKGNIDAETGIKALLQGMMQAYGGGMQSFAQTAEGMSSTLNDYLADIQRGFGQIAYKEYRLLLNDVSKLVASPAFTKFANMLGVQFGGAIKRLNDDVLRPAIVRMTDFVNALGSTDAGMQNFFNGLMQRLRPVTDLLRSMSLAFGKVSSIVRDFVMTFMKTEQVRRTAEWLVYQMARLTERLNDFGRSSSITGRSIYEFANMLARNLQPAGAAILHFIPVVQEAGKIVAEIVKQLFQLNTTQSLLTTVRTTYETLWQTFDALVPRLIRFREAIPSMTRELVNSLGPARAVLSGFADTLMASGRFILEFIRQITGLKQVQDTVSSIPDRLNAFADALHMVAGRINEMTAKLPGWFDYLERLPSIIQNWIASIMPLDQTLARLGTKVMELAQVYIAKAIPIVLNYLDMLKNKALEVIQSAVNFVMQFSLVGQTIRVTSEVFKRVTASLEPFVRFLVNMVAAILKAIGVTMNFNDIFGSIARGVERVLAAIASVLPSLDQMTSVFSALVTLIRTAWPIVIDLIGRAITVITQLADVVSANLPKLSPIFGTVLDGVQKVLNAIISLVPQAIPGIISLVGSLSRIVDSVLPFKDLLVPAIESIIRVLGILQVSAMSSMAAFGTVAARNLDSIRAVSEKVISVIGTLLSIMDKLAAGVAPIISSWVPLFNRAVDVVMKLVQVFADMLLPILNTLQRPFNILVDGLIKLVDILTPAVAALGSATNKLLAFIEPFTSNVLQVAVNGILGIASALNGLIVALANAASSGDFTTVRTKTTELVNALAKGIGDLVSNVFSPSNVAYALTEGRARLTSFIIETLTAILRGAIDGIANNLPGIIEGIKNWGGEFIPMLISGIQNSWAILSGSIQFSSSGLSESLGRLWDVILAETGLKGQSISSILGNIPAAIGNLWQENSPAIMAGLGAVWNIITTQLDNLWNWIKEKIGSREQFANMIYSLSDNLIAWYSDFIAKVYSYLGDLTNKVTDWLNSPDLQNTFITVMNKIGVVAAEIGDQIGVILVETLETLIKTGYAAITNLAKYLLNNFGPFLAAVLRFVNMITTAVSGVILDLIKGLITGMMRALGLTEWIPYVETFFNNLKSAMIDNSIRIQNALTEFSNWWRSLELGTMLKKFADDTVFFATTVVPGVARLLAQLPQVLLDQANIGIKNAMNSLLTGLSNTMTALLNGIGQGGLASQVQAIIGGWMNGVNQIGGSFTDAASRIANYANDVANLDAQMRAVYGGTSSRAARTLASTAAVASDSVTAIKSTLAGVASVDTSSLAANVTATATTVQNAVSDMAKSIEANVVPQFQSLGNAIAYGIASGFSSAWGNVSGSIASAVGGVANMNVGVSGRAAGNTVVTNVQNRSVDMNVTINQTTPTATYDNLRYAQALAQAKIF